MIHRENTEIRNQSHEMWIEGMEDDKPTEDEIIDFVNGLGYATLKIEIWYDSMQCIYRWYADIKEFDLR